MNNRIFFILLFSLLPYNTILPQSMEKEKEKNIIIENCIETYTYGIEKGNVIIESTEDYTFSCEQYKASFRFYDFYNEHIRIDKIKINANKKKIKPEYKPYNGRYHFNSGQRVCTFIIPFSKKGEKADVNIQKTIMNPRFFAQIPIVEPLHTKQKTITITVPRWMDMEVIPVNFSSRFDIKYSSAYDTKKDMDVHTFTASDLNPLSADDNAPGIECTYPYLIVVNRSSNYKNKTETYFRNLEDLYIWNKEFIDNIEDNDSLALSKSKEIVAGCNSDMEKIRAIYSWVQNNIRYLINDVGKGGYQPGTIQETLKRGYGDCKDMANLAKTLLRSQGFDARLAWIHTEDIGNDFKYPSLSPNHMICALFYNDSVYYLDPTVEYIYLGDYPSTIEGRTVMIENGDSYLMKKVPVRGSEQNITIHRSTLEINDGILSGNSMMSFSGESRNLFLYAVNYTKKEQLNEKIKSYLSMGNPLYSISELNTYALDIKNKEVTVSYELADKANINQHGNNYYINLDPRKELNSLKIDTDKRELDFLHPFKYHIITTNELVVPDNMQVTYMPQSLLIERDGYTFRINYSLNDNTIIYSKELIIKERLIPKSDFTQWNDDINHLREAYREQINITR